MVEKLRRFRRWEDRDLSLVGKLMLQHGLSQLGLPTDLHAITTESYGRPVLPYPQLDFNISHSGTLVVTAISTSGRIGIDIEQVTAIDLSDFSRFFKAEELDQIRQANDTSEAFFTLWTQKEALIKADGRGLSLDKELIDLQPTQGTIQENTWYLQALAIAKGYQAHIATATANPTITFPSFSLDSFHYS
ncbi:MAG: 4'-phosphopantetheinyl transferase superfamily protein [Bacteroidota bacterium]